MEPALEGVALLACPRCGAGLEPVRAGLECRACRAAYEVRGGIPDLTPWSGGRPDPEWDHWRDKLDRLQQWRRETWDGSASAAERQSLADALAEEFFRFARVPEGGVVLEVGCGDGGLRRFLPRRRYWGIDPLLGEPGAPRPRPDEGGPGVFLRGVGERLPLAPGTVETVLLCETMDHCLDARQVLREARRVLRPGGLLAVMQSVEPFSPLPPLRVRLRAAAGRLRARLRGRRPSGGDRRTKVRPLGQDELAALVGSEFVVESGMQRGTVLFLRALRQDVAAARAPKRSLAP